MQLIRQLGLTSLAAALVALANFSHAATIPVTGWVVHNTVGSITVAGAATNSPTFTPADVAADASTLMAPFDPVSLANDGDFIKVTASLTMSGRTTTGINTLNNNLRFGLFGGPAGAVVAGDSPNQGIQAQYARSPQGHLKVFEQSSAAADPMDPSQTLIADQSNFVTIDPEDDAIQGATATADYVMTITRTGGNLAITGQISGGSYLSSFNIPTFNSATYPTNGSPTFNRVGFLIGNNVNAAQGAAFSNVTVETNVVPEPASLFLVLAAVVGAATFTSRRR
jgi:hypothetical protein